MQFNLHVPRILEIELNNVKIQNKNSVVLIHFVSQLFLLKFVLHKNFRF